MGQSDSEDDSMAGSRRQQQDNTVRAWTHRRVDQAVCNICTAGMMIAVLNVLAASSSIVGDALVHLIRDYPGPHVLPVFMYSLGLVIFYAGLPLAVLALCDWLSRNTLGDRSAWASRLLAVASRAKDQSYPRPRSPTEQ